MTFCSARREALSKPTIGKPFKCAIYPSEAKRLFHYFDVRNSWPLGGDTYCDKSPPNKISLYCGSLWAIGEARNDSLSVVDFQLPWCLFIGLSLNYVFIKFAHIAFPLFKVSHYLHCTFRLLAIYFSFSNGLAHCPTLYKWGSLIPQVAFASIGSANPRSQQAGAKIGQSIADHLSEGI